MNNSVSSHVSQLGVIVLLLQLESVSLPVGPLEGVFTEIMCFCFSWFRHTHRKIEEGAQLEAEWNAKLALYEATYPKEAAEFKQLVSGKLPEGWEKALPVSATNCWRCVLPMFL